jgi:hypothetical protein
VAQLCGSGHAGAAEGITQLSEGGKTTRGTVRRLGGSAVVVAGDEVTGWRGSGRIPGIRRRMSDRGYGGRIPRQVGHVQRERPLTGGQHQHPRLTRQWRTEEKPEWAG